MKSLYYNNKKEMPFSPCKERDCAATYEKELELTMKKLED